MCCGGMQMVFTTSWRDAPILFDTWAPSGVGSHVGSIFAIIFMAMLLRAMTMVCQQMKPGFRKASMVTVTMGLGYLVMLISMTYIVAYFFAILIGIFAAEWVSSAEVFQRRIKTPQEMGEKVRDEYSCH